MPDAVPAGPWLQPPEVTDGRLFISREVYDKTLRGLAARSADWRESAAVWAGTMTGVDSFVTSVSFHHELCDDRGGPLSLELTEDAKFALYQTLRDQNLKLISLIHTHPEDWVGLSLVDQNNQLCSRIGFWSLVVPRYGRYPWDLSAFGVHVKGNEGWVQLSAADAKERVQVREEQNDGTSRR